MTSMDTNNRAGGLALLPPLWLAFVMAMSAWGIWTSWPFTYDFEIPADVLYFIYAGMAANLVTILWGSWLLALAASRSQRFPTHFIVWQIADIAWLVAQEIFVLVIPDFSSTLRSTVLTLAQIAVGVLCIAILRRKPGEGMPPPVYSNPETTRPSAFVSVIIAFLGLILGGAVGFGLGLGAGILIAEATDISCFEGACGFFAFFLGLGGMIIGAIGGAVFAVRRVNRRRAAVAA